MSLKIVMLVDNGVEGDSRVQKTARSAGEAGHDVTLLGVSPDGAGHRWRIGDAEVRLLPMGGGAGDGGVKARLKARGGWLLRAARLARRPVEQTQVRFWSMRAGDRAWRHLEPGLWNYERAFGPVIDELWPDLIHAHDFRMLGVGARAAGRTGAKLVWDAHEFLPGARPRRDNARWLPAHLAYEREYARRADAVVTVSDTLAEMLQAEHGLPERPTVVLNAPDAPVATGGRDLRRDCGVGPDTPLLVYSGSQAPQRGIADLIAAVRMLDGVHLALVVPDPAAFQGHDRVHALPYVPHDQVSAYLAGADAGVIPIHHWPNHEIALITKFFEYAHARLPIVVSDVRTMAATVRATGQGEVFRAGDPADLARAVRLVLADPQRYRAVYDGPDSPLPGWTWAAQAGRLAEVYRRVMREPDVSVVLAVYNTMPYLTECLDSLAAQTIGHGRMQIVAVDDGSSDGSGAELDRFAAAHPGLVTVEHQANSGGPAGPFNRGLDLATGRYVFFVGADDTLGPEALQRLVAAADEWESDVVLGQVAGVNSRHIFQDVFARTEADLDLFGPVLPRSLANTKLFRRALLDRHGIRYREDMRIGSDLPFTLEACYRAKRISVLAGYDFYFAVRRFGGDNITYLSRHGLRVQTVAKVMDFVAALIPPGAPRDAILVRRFDHEVARLLEDDFLQLDPELQRQVQATVGRITDEHLTDAIAAQLGAETRIRLQVARDGSAADLVAVIRQDAEVGVPPVEERDGRRYARYPGVEVDVTGLPDWPSKLDVVAVRGLTFTVRGEIPPGTKVFAEEVLGRVDGATVRFRAADVLAAAGPAGRRLIVAAGPDPALAPGARNATGAAGAAAVRAPRWRSTRPLLRLHKGRLYAVAPVKDPSGRLMISVVPLTARRIVARLRR